MKNLAIIPARSGSKGLPDKNIRDLCGKPLMSYSIDAALKSECFDTVMLSTDSEKYAKIGREYGAEVPFLRSEAMSSDTADSWDVVGEVLEIYQDMGQEFDTFCLLQPTSPMRTAEDIRKAYDLFKSHASFGVISVCEAEHSPLWCGQLPDNCELANFLKQNHGNRRQDVGKYYRLNGAIYIANVKMFKKDRNFYKEGSYAYIMKQERSIDIDTELDFMVADALMRGELSEKLI